jgi:hypothetical protein
MSAKARCGVQKSIVELQSKEFAKKFVMQRKVTSSRVLAHRLKVLERLSRINSKARQATMNRA